MVRNNHLFESILWFSVGLWFLWGGLKLGVGDLHNPDAGFFPIIIGGVLSLLSVAFFIATLLGKGSVEQVSFWKEKKSWKRVLAALLSLIFYNIFLDYLGYMTTTFLFFIYLLKFIGKKRWATSIVVAILASFLSYLLFHVVMGVPLPKEIFNIKLIFNS